MKTRSTFQMRMAVVFPLWIVTALSMKEPTFLQLLASGFIFLGITAAIDFAEFIVEGARSKPAAVRGPVPGPGGTGGACPAPPLVRLEIRHQNQTGVIVKITASGPVSLDVVDEQMNLEKTFTLLENECVVMTLDEIGNL